MKDVFLKRGVFEPEIVKAVGDAYDAICSELYKGRQDAICR